MRNLKNNPKANKGITLIALVITIVVLIILAAVVISLSLNSNGIFNRAKQAKDEYANSQSYEAQQVNALDAEITKHINDKNDIPNVPTYTITYNLDGGSITGEKNTYKSNDDNYTLPLPTKDGCTFIGWTGSNGETPQTTVIISKGSTEDKEYAANWASSTFGTNYTQLEYIQSTGVQYINTGYKPKNNTGIYADFEFTDVETTQQRLYSAECLTNDNTGLCYSFYINGGNCFAYTYQNSTGNWINTGYVVDILRHKLKFNINNTKNMYLDNESYSIEGTATNDAIYNMMIFANIRTGSIDGYGKLKLYYFKIYEGNTLIRNYVPCKRKTDNKPGLYDIINNVFYINQGSSTDFYIL